MKKLIAFILAFSLLLGLCACGTEASEEAPAQTVEFTDDTGRTVSLPSDLSRIVPSGPLAQIILFAIAPDMFVGLASKWDACAEGIIPEEYYDLPYFGQIYGSADLNVEELAAAAPQLIVDIGEAKGSIVEDLDELTTQTGIPAVHIAATLETMPQTYRTLGKLLGREEKGEELAQFCETVYGRTLSIMEQVGENKVNALYVTGEEGLNVLAYSSYHAELLDILVNNLAVVDEPSSKGTGNAVSMEQIAVWNPDFVIFAPDSIYATVTENEAWSQIAAIESGHYIETPQGPHNWMGSPPAVQRYLGMIWLTATLYPEYCDYDMKADVLEYYRLFYGCALTDAQYAALTANALPQA